MNSPAEANRDRRDRSRWRRVAVCGAMLLTPLVLAADVAATGTTPGAGFAAPVPAAGAVNVDGTLPKPIPLDSAVFRHADRPKLLAQDGPPVVLPDGPAGIPGSALRAYQAAERTLAAERPGCHAGWSLLASIGRIESGHARGGALDANGNTLQPILGPVLNGGPFAAISDTDDGALDGDTAWDRAVGPMQFIPSTWRGYAADGNTDGTSSPHNIHDAVLAAGRYLCAGGLDLSDPHQRAVAVFRYNHSSSYVRTVLLWADAYQNGVTPTPDASGSSGVEHRADGGSRHAGSTARSNRSSGSADSTPANGRVENGPSDSASSPSTPAPRPSTPPPPARTSEAPPPPSETPTSEPDPSGEPPATTEPPATSEPPASSESPATTEAAPSTEPSSGGGTAPGSEPSSAGPTTTTQPPATTAHTAEAPPTTAAAPKSQVEAKQALPARKPAPGRGPAQPAKAAQATTTAPGGGALTTVEATVGGTPTTSASTPIADPSDPAATDANTAQGDEGPSGDLPTTGSSVGLMALAGLVLIGAGVVLVLAVRRRRADPRPTLRHP